MTIIRDDVFQQILSGKDKGINGLLYTSRENDGRRGGMMDFNDRVEESKKVKDFREAQEALHMRNLMGSESGKWILAKIVRVFEQEVRGTQSGHNSDAAYHRGRQDFAREWRDLIVKHFGFEGLDKIGDLK